MKIMCKQNFLCNKVAGSPGKFLSNEEVEQIGGLLGELKAKGLIHGGDELVGEASPVAGSGADLVGDNLPVDEVEEPTEDLDNDEAAEASEKPKHKKKSKR